MKIINLFAAPGVVPQWVSDSFRYFRLAFVCLLIVLAVILIVSVMLQPSSQEGLGAISGGSDTFFSKNKGRTREGMLLRMTIVVSIVIFVLALTYLLTLSLYSPENPFNQEAPAAIIQSALGK